MKVFICFSVTLPPDRNPLVSKANVFLDLSSFLLFLLDLFPLKATTSFHVDVVRLVSLAASLMKFSPQLVLGTLRYTPLQLSSLWAFCDECENISAAHVVCCHVHEYRDKITCTEEDGRFGSAATSYLFNLHVNIRISPSRLTRLSWLALLPYSRKVLSLNEPASWSLSAWIVHVAE